MVLTNQWDLSPEFGERQKTGTLDYIGLSPTSGEYTRDDMMHRIRRIRGLIKAERRGAQEHQEGGEGREAEENDLEASEENAYRAREGRCQSGQAQAFSASVMTATKLLDKRSPSQCQQPRGWIGRGILWLMN